MLVDASAWVVLTPATNNPAATVVEAKILFKFLFRKIKISPSVYKT
ncbi:hypothetical protein [Lactobacillus sp. Sy-1]